jgi:DNA-binding transcriptional LysR family regulator
VAIAAFRERHPAVELSVVMADPADSIPRLRAGELDLALSHDAFFGDPGQERGSGSAAVGRPSTGGRNPSTDGRGPSTDGRGPSAAAPAGLELVHLFDDPMYVAMRAGHPLAESPSLRLADFATEPWMLATTHTCPDSRLFLRACHAAGFEPTIAFQNDDYPAILGFVAAGVGVAMIPDMVARSVRDDVVVRDLDPPAPRRPILATVPYGYRSPAVSAMLAVLKEVSGEWVASRPPLSFPAKSDQFART